MARVERDRLGEIEMRLINEPRYESWNTQAMPKSYLPMHALRARAGHKLISCDFDSLELLLVGELSREPNIVKLMLPGAPPNDLHIMTATSFPAPFGTTMRSLGYDPEKPTKDALDRIKADEKGRKIRDVAKTCLAADSLVLTKHCGWLPIALVKAGDFVYDGQEFVHTDGAQFMGVKATIELGVIKLTPDHLVLDKTQEWQIASVTQKGSLYEVEESPNPCSWAIVWKLVVYLVRAYISRKGLPS
jgi:hypothetical protein